MQIQNVQPQRITPIVDPNDMVMVPVAEYLELKQIARSQQLQLQSFRQSSAQPTIVSNSHQWQPVKWFLLGSATMCGLGLLGMAIVPDPPERVVEKPVYIPMPVETPSPVPAQNQQNETCVSNCNARNFSILGGN